MLQASTLLSGLKIDLGITTTAYDERLTVYLQMAQASITREGITLANNAEDNTLTQMYAAWLWHRRDTGEGMPRMLRLALNNRVFSEKMQ